MPSAGGLYSLPPSVPAPHPILIPHNDQQPPPGLIKQQPPSSQAQNQQPKTNSISIEKIPAPPQPGFTIHRRLLPEVVPSTYRDYFAEHRDFYNNK